MSKIKLARDEFKRLRTVLRAHGNIRILYYSNKNDFAGSERSAAYTYPNETPPLIVLRKGRGITYKSLLFTLLHEYGHIIDERLYGKSVRSNLYGTSPLEEPPEVIVKYSRKVKYAILKTELIVENMIPKLWKQYNIKLPFDAKFWELEKAMTLQATKYWLIYGVPPTKKLSLTWKKSWKCSPWYVNDTYIKDFSGV